MSIKEIEAYRTESVFGNQKEIYEKRLGFSLDYYKYLEEFNIVKLTTQDGLEYFGIKSIIYALSKFDSEILKKKDNIVTYFEQKIRDPQEVVDLDNSDNHTSYKLSIDKNPAIYKFIKDESLRKTCQDIGAGKFIPRCLVIHFSEWLSNRFYLRIQRLIEKCESEKIRRELNTKDSKIAELSAQLVKHTAELKETALAHKKIVNRFTNTIQKCRHNIDVSSRITFFNEEKSFESKAENALDFIEDQFNKLQRDLEKADSEVIESRKIIKEQSKQLEENQEHTEEIMKQVNDLKVNHTDDRANGVTRYIMLNYKRDGKDLHINAGFGEEKNVKRTLQKYVDSENYSWGVKIEWINPRTEFKGTYEEILKKKYTVKSNYSCNRFTLIDCQKDFKSVVEDFINELSIKYNQVFDDIMDHCFNIIEFSDFKDSLPLSLEDIERDYIPEKYVDEKYKYFWCSMFIDFIPIGNNKYKYIYERYMLPMDIVLKYRPITKDNFYNVQVLNTIVDDVRQDMNGYLINNFILAGYAHKMKMFEDLEFTERGFTATFTQEQKDLYCSNFGAIAYLIEMTNGDYIEFEFDYERWKH